MSDVNAHFSKKAQNISGFRQQNIFLPGKDYRTEIPIMAKYHHLSACSSGLFLLKL